MGKYGLKQAVDSVRYCRIPAQFQECRKDWKVVRYCAPLKKTVNISVFGNAKTVAPILFQETPFFESTGARLAIILKF